MVTTAPGNSGNDVDKPVPGRRSPGRPARARQSPLERADILDAAQAIIECDGLDGLNMRDLAARLGVTPGALYNHVPSKADLLEQLVERVWGYVLSTVDSQSEDLVEWLVTTNVQIRRAWLENLELANLALGVAEVDDGFYNYNRFMATVIEAARFPDVPATFNAVMTFTMGSVAIIANRRMSSTRFGRDPDEILERARLQLDEKSANANQRGVTESRFDPGEDVLFEACLRAVVTALHTEAPTAINWLHKRPDPPAHAARR